MNSSPEYGVRWTPSAEKSGVGKLGRRWRLGGQSRLRVAEGSTISLVHVVPDVGISNQAKSLDLDGEVGLRHDVVRRRPEQE